MSYEINMTTRLKMTCAIFLNTLAFTLQSPQNAAGQLERLEGSIDSLAQMPERFRVYDKEPWRSRNLRIMPVDYYFSNSSGTNTRQKVWMTLCRR